MEISPMAARTFPRFSSLPIEIRLTIWKNALPAGPRIVYLKHDYVPPQCSRVWDNLPNDIAGNAEFFDLVKDPDHARRQFVPKDFSHFSSMSTVPMVHACKESQLVAQSYGYVQAFGKLGSSPTTTFNFELDTLYLDWGYEINRNDGWDSFGSTEQGCFRTFRPEHLGSDIRRVQKLAFCAGQPDLEVFKFEFNRWLAKLLAEFGNVQKLTLALLDEEQNACNKTCDLVFLDFEEFEDELPYRCDCSPTSTLHPELLDCWPEIWFLHQYGWKDPTSSSGVIDLRWLEQLRTQNVAGDAVLPTWSMPQIDAKLITTPEEKAKMSSIRKSCNEERDAERRIVTIRSTSYETFTLETTLLTTFDEMVAAFREARGVDPLLTAIFNHIVQIDDEELLLDVEGRCKSHCVGGGPVDYRRFEIAFV